MPSGTIKFFNAGKGFGFVTPDIGDADIFLPATALTASGLGSVKQGQRVTFEQAPDTKGPKVIALKLLGDPPPVKAYRPPPDQVSVYCDPSSDIAADVLNEVRGAGYQLQLHDYISTPLELESLRRLSQVLSEAGQSLVRRYDPLFLALRLDDRFITDQDFWTGIAEHPTLINSPVLQQSGKARICRSPGEARAFLNNAADTVQNPKSLSPRIAAMLKGEAVPETPSPANGNDPAAEILPNPKSPQQKTPPPKPAKISAAKAAVKPDGTANAISNVAKSNRGKAVVEKAVRPVKKAKKSSKE
jgi:cold shock CspA family protein/arsenate reductase-like glutaredoxin family protein